MIQEPKLRSQGVLRQADGNTTWCVWAPWSTAVSLVTFDLDGRRETPMAPVEGNYFLHRQSPVEEGLRYAYRLDDGREYPDPASRWQPDGVHRPTAVFFPEAFPWSDAAWPGIARKDLAIYELHVGAFTHEGTLRAIIPRFDDLLSLGITAVELMPVAQFAGDRNWGYDTVYPFAVQNSYGGPRALQRLVDAAHRAGLAVILDVVYNHFGPEGCYLGSFGPYSTDRYRTPWGTAVNYDGPGSDAVRRFVVDNARTWVRDFHVDGLRLDAVHAIYDFSPRHILAEIQSAVQREAALAGRVVHVIAESDQNDVRLVRPPRRGGYGLDAVWSDDFHHSVHAFLTGEHTGFHAGFGSAEDVAKAINDVFVYDGRYSTFRRRRHGSRVGRIDRTRFVVEIQNHDQIGNRPTGQRLSALLGPEAQRLACGLLLLSPCVPLLFMGEEYGETRPFPFFCSFDDPELIEAIRRGRREEFAAFVADNEVAIPDAQDARTFAQAKLAWEWPDGSPQAQRRHLYQDLLAARRRWPALRDRRHTAARLVVEGQPRDGRQPAVLLVLQRGGPGAVTAVANLADRAIPTPALDGGERTLLLSTEDARYGGSRSAEHSLQEILKYEILVFASGKSHATDRVPPRRAETDETTERQTVGGPRSVAATDP